MLAVEQYHGDRFRKQFLGTETQAETVSETVSGTETQAETVSETFLVQKHKQKLFRK